MQPKTAGTRSGFGPLRRVAVGVGVIGLVIASSAAIGMARDDGRDDGVVPGTPTDTPTPVVDESNTRDAGATVRATTGLRDAGGLSGPLDNGRGGVDPAAGPLPVPEQMTAAATAAPANDSDAGVAQARDADKVLAAVDEDLVDQDVPGAATASTAGSDQPSLDADG